MENLLNNEVVLEGYVNSEAEISHEIYGEKFYKFNLEVLRLSENADNIIITMSERLMEGCDLSIGSKIKIYGQFRSYNNYSGEGNKLVLTVFVKRFAEEEEEEYLPNTVYLNGYICKEPVYRVTPFGREICDVLLAVNRRYGKSDYIPCITWGRNAKFTESLPVGTNVKIWGRIQSREYKKKINEEEFITKTAYEVSVTKMETTDEEWASSVVFKYKKVLTNKTWCAIITSNFKRKDAE